MLWKKVFRDLKGNKGAYAACVAVIVIGLMIFTSYSIVMDNLTLSQKTFYSTQNFADGFAQVRAMPYREAEKLKEIEGVQDLQGRLVKDVRVLFPGSEENVYLRLVSVDPDHENPINGVMLIQGIPLEGGEMNLWVDNKFFEANGLELNQEIQIIAEGKKRSLRIAGVGRSPEFIYALRTSSDIYPDPKKFGIAFIPYDTMQALFSENQVINSIVFTLEPGASYTKVEQQLEPKLKPYGLLRIYPRKDQTSHLLLTQELKGLKAMARTMPAIFLTIAGLILYIVLRRMIEHQRGQIGILKAFGYTDGEIMFHYMSYALIIGAAGGVIGGLTGIALSFPFTSMYQMFFNMPGLKSKFSMTYFLISIFLSLAFAAFAGYQGCKGILTLQPAEAMRPPAPPSGKKTWLEKIDFFWNMLTVQGRMAVRNLSRNRRRSLFMFVGIMFAFSLGVLTWATKDLSEQMLFDQYEKIETYNVKVALTEPMEQKEVIRELGRFPGVQVAETMAEIPVTLKNKWHEKSVVLLGLPQNSKLYNILDKNNNRVEPPERGVLVSERLAELLDADTGTQLTVESPWMKDPGSEKQVEVVGVIPQYLGLNAYMEIGAVQNLLDQGEIATSVMLLMEEDKIPLLQEEYRNSAAVNGVTNRAEMFNQMKELMASFSWGVFVLALFAIATGFAVVYNISIIALSERSRELATMMVLGMTPAEVLSVITFEQWFLGAFAMIAGIPLAKIMLVGLAQAINNDVYTMPTNMSAMSILMAFVITAASIWIAQRMAAKKIRDLSLVEVLKAQE